MSANNGQQHPPWYKREPNEERDRELAARTEKRAAIAAARVRVEELRRKGDAAFAKGSYLMAKEYYNQAFYSALGQSATSSVLLDLARTYLKLNSPEAAERFATIALELDPKNVDARCLRGRARMAQKRFCAAIIDFDVALRLSPGHDDAWDGRKSSVKEQDKLRANDGEEIPADLTDNNPVIAGEIVALPKPKLDDDAASDTSDYNHEANGIPCRHYNQSRCSRGELCNYSHGPTKWAIRDQLGRNVCISFILGHCKYTLDKCYYSHSTAYLAPTKTTDGDSIKWWTYPDIIRDWRKLREYSRDASRVLHEDMLRDRRAYNRSLKSGDGGTRARSTGGACGSRKPKGEWDDGDDWSSDDEGYGFGFGGDAWDELICQGVKPWDDDACAVLGAIYDY
ncbi:TPR-like protein [Auricularia subglabra TFB-10046 SS5]|nr:TPR-like protein [Auricularia subglabra TFB-10046 SS5]